MMIERFRSECKIEGISISLLTRQQILDEIIFLAKQENKSKVLNCNIHSMNIATKQKWFFNFYQDAKLIFCDGVGIKLAAKILKLPIPVRMTPPDWFEYFCEMCSAENLSLSFVGGSPGVTENLAKKLRNEIPSLSIKNSEHGYHDKEVNSEDNVLLIKRINAGNPDILVVGMGMPLQEKWILENIDKLNARVYLPVGAMFDYLMEEVRRGPRWMTDNGFEWLARLFIEPGRLWKRYVIGNPVFFYRILKEKLLMMLSKVENND